MFGYKFGQKGKHCKENYEKMKLRVPFKESEITI